MEEPSFEECLAETQIPREGQINGIQASRFVDGIIALGKSVQSSKEANESPKE
jgi:hypothetical protein